MKKKKFKKISKSKKMMIFQKPSNVYKFEIFIEKLSKFNVLFDVRFKAINRNVIIYNVYRKKKYNIVMCFIL